METGGLRSRDPQALDLHETRVYVATFPAGSRPNADRLTRCFDQQSRGSTRDQEVTAALMVSDSSESVREVELA